MAKAMVRDRLAEDEAAWSFGSLISGFTTTKDDQGRPLYENRAPAIVKEGVPMVMRRCGYPDERRGKMMNLSALTQITAQLEGVLAEIRRFHNSLPDGPPSWDRFCWALNDQLGQPALHALRSKSKQVVIPTLMSVGYKVAAGYLVPTREIMSRCIQGAELPMTKSALLGYIRERGSLVGAREVCAAPMAMVERVSEAFLGMNRDREAGHVDADRLQLSRALTDELWIGLLWRSYDLAIERQLLTGDLRGALRPRTAHVAGQLSARLEAMAAEPDVAPRLPAGLDAELSRRLRAAMVPREPGENDAPLLQLTSELVARQEGAITLLDGSLAELVSRRFVAYLATYLEFVSLFEEVEVSARVALGCATKAPVLHDPSFFPEPRALRWLELVLGHRLRRSAEQSAMWVLKNQHRVVEVPRASTSLAS